MPSRRFGVSDDKAEGMTVSLERTFRVRHYECDAYENVYYTNYLRYIQEAAMDASASIGFDAAWYAEQGTTWLVRETDIEFIRPLRYGDSVRVKTWVENFRHAMSLRSYELRMVDSGELVARAGTEWVYLDAARGRPTRIPEQFKTLFFADGPPQPPPPRERFPQIEPPECGVFRQRRRVEWRDIDPAQHVNNSVYLAYAEDAAVEASMAVGWSPARMRGHGFNLRVRRVRIEYKISAVLGDDLEIATWLSDRTDRTDRPSVSGGTATRYFHMMRIGDGALVARALIDLTCLDVATGEAIPFPAAYRSALG
jgi:acyl-CoA thioester hydrolase